jgi:hypothetical protein
MKNRGVAAAAGLPEALPVDDFEPLDAVEVAVVREERQLVLEAEGRDPQVVQEAQDACSRSWNDHRASRPEFAIDLRGFLIGT